MKLLGTVAALLLALLAHTALTRVAPAPARLFDPFLVILVFCALAGGEVHGMLAGAAGGWIQDANFGGTVVGISGLSKLVVGFVVCVAGSRFLVTGPAQRLLTLFAATLIDGLFLERLADMFGVPILPLSFAGLLGRAAVNAVVGTGLFLLFDRALSRGGA